MSGFGGAVKLTGESEYRKALQNITQGLREVSAQMKLTSTEYDKSDKSSEALTAQSKNLSNQLDLQKSKVTQLTNQYKSMASQYQTNAQKHNSLVGEYNKEKAKLDEIGRTLGTTSKEYQEQKTKVEDLAKQVIKSSNAQEQNAKTMSNMRIQIANAQSDVNKTSKALDELGNEEEEAGQKAKNASNGGFTVLKGVLADLSSKAIQTAISGIKKLGSAVLDVGKQAISSYAEYEQLVGGVETLFKDSAKTVENYANIAYKTAGLSANEYMETVTSFSASLLQGLGGDTKKAAEIADMAIIDMSDNANKMGTSMESIQNAYQGFAKQNYTMLDNLKLGYGGTKEEMARLVKESGILGKAGDDLTAKNLDQKVSYDQIIEAIHKVQTNMGITGTTSKEASSTISGSVTSMKKSWKNLLTAIADNNKDLSKSVNEFVDSAITASKNLVPKIKVVVSGIKKLINSIVTEVFPKIKKEIPELAPLIETFEWFVKHKSVVVGAIKAMVTAFAVNKIVNFTKSITDGAKNLLDMAKNMSVNTTATNLNTTATTANTTAQVAGATATKGLATAQNLLNAAWKANPIGLITTGVTAAITVFSIFKNKTNELTEAEKEQKKALEEQTNTINNNKEAWDDLVESKDNAINAGMTELSHYESLYDELIDIVDANGKVKKGYEQRVSFITSTLSEALGIEINTVNGVIQKYDDLKSTIDQVMKKKKAQIILDSQESLYAEAINKQTEGIKLLNEAEAILNVQKEKRSSLQDELAKKEEEYNKLIKTNSESMINYANTTTLTQIEGIRAKIKAQDEEVSKAQSNYNTQKTLLQEYAYNIGLYESNMALAHAGEYDKMSTVTWDYVKDYQKAGDAEKSQLEAQIEITRTNLGILKELKDKSGSDLYDSQIKASEKQLAELEDSLKKYNSITDTELGKTEVIWSDGLDDQLSEITHSKIEFKDAGNDQVQAYIDGVKVGKPRSKEEMVKLTNESIAEITKQKGNARNAGEDLLDGVNNGISNGKKQGGVFATIRSFGNKLLANLRSSLEEHSPSKATNEMGQFLLQGLGLGIEDEEDSVLKQVNNFGKSVISSLNSSLSENVGIGAISKIKNSIPNKYNSGSRVVNNNESYNDIVSAFKEALSQMKIEMDDEEMGKFVDRTVSSAIYT